MKIRERQSNQKRVAMALRTGWHNSVKCSKGRAERPQHRRAKFCLANFCWEYDLSFYTEAVFHNEERADFIIADWCLVIEILHTEELKTFRKKTYPFPTVPVPSWFTEAQITLMLTDLLAMDGSNASYYTERHLALLQHAGKSEAEKSVNITTY